MPKASTPPAPSVAEVVFSAEHLAVLRHLQKLASTGAPPRHIARECSLPLVRVYELGNDLLTWGLASRPQGTSFHLTPAGQARLDARAGAGDPAT